MYDLKENEEVGRIRESQNKIYSIALNNSDNTLFYGSSDHNIRVYDLNNNTIVQSLKGHTKYIWVLKVTKDYRFLFSGGGDCKIRIWDLQNKYKLAHTINHKTTVISIHISRKSRRVYFGGASYQPIKAVDVGKILKGVKGMKSDKSQASMITMNSGFESDNSGFLEPEREISNRPSRFSEREENMLESPNVVVTPPQPEFVEDHSKCQLEISHLHLQIEQLQDELKRRADLIKESENLAGQREYQLNLMSTQVSGLQGALNSKEEERQKQQRKVEIGVEREELLNKKINLLTKKLKDLNDENQREKTLKQMRSEKRRRELDDLEGKLKERDRANSELNFRIKDLGEKLYDVKGDMNEYREANNRLRKKLNVLEGDNEENLRKVGERDRLIRDLEEKLRARQSELEKEKRTVSDNEADIRDLKEREREFKRELREREEDAVKRGKNDAARELQNLKTQMREEFERQLRKLREQNERFQVRVEMLTKENSSLMTKYRSETTRINTIRHTQTNNQDNTIIKDLISQLKGVNHLLTREKESQIQKNRILSAEHFKLRKRHEQSKKKETDMEKQLKKVQLNFAKLMNAQENLIRESGSGLSLSNNQTDRYLEKLTRHLNIKVMEEESGERFSLGANRSQRHTTAFKKKPMNVEVKNQFDLRTNVTTAQRSYRNMNSETVEKIGKEKSNPQALRNENSEEMNLTRTVEKNRVANDFIRQSDTFQQMAQVRGRNTDLSLGDPTRLRLSRNQ